MKNLELNRKKTYTVTLAGNQSHIKTKVYENCYTNWVAKILDDRDEEYPMPEADGNFWEYDGDRNICIEEAE